MIISWLLHQVVERMAVESAQATKLSDENRSSILWG